MKITAKVRGMEELKHDLARLSAGGCRDGWTAMRQWLGDGLLAGGTRTGDAERTRRSRAAQQFVLFTLC